MIEFPQLEDGKVANLRAWLFKPESEILIAQLRAKSLECRLKAAQAMIDAKRNPYEHPTAELALRDAMALDRMVEMINQMRGDNLEDSPEFPFIKATLNPNDQTYA